MLNSVTYLQLSLLKGFNAKEIANKRSCKACTAAAQKNTIFNKKQVHSIQQLLAHRIEELENMVEQMTAA